MENRLKNIYDNYECACLNWTEELNNCRLSKQIVCDDCSDYCNKCESYYCITYNLFDNCSNCLQCLTKKKFKFLDFLHKTYIKMFLLSLNRLKIDKNVFPLPLMFTVVNYAFGKTYDKNTCIGKVRILLNEIENSHKREDKLIIIEKVFNYLVVNKKFVHQYDCLKNVVREKFLSFVIENNVYFNKQFQYIFEEELMDVVKDIPHQKKDEHHNKNLL